MQTKIAIREIREHLTVLKLLINNFHSFLNIWECILIINNIDRDYKLNYYKSELKNIKNHINKLIKLSKRAKSPSNIHLTFQAINSWAFTVQKILKEAYEIFDKQTAKYKPSYFT